MALGGKVASFQIIKQLKIFLSHVLLHYKIKINTLMLQWFIGNEIKMMLMDLGQSVF